MSFQFPPAIRLRARHEFAAVQDHGRRVATKYLTLLGRPNAGDRDRLGIIASRRLGGAVTRNRAKRRLREVFRTQRSDTTLMADARTLDLVAIPRRELLTVPLPVVEADFQGALRRLRALK